MKKLLLISLAFISLNAFAQNKFTYPIYARGGISIGDERISGTNIIKVDSITSDGTNIYFWKGGSILTAVPGVGGATWGTISGSIINQLDLAAALNAKGSGTLVPADTLHLSDRINAKGSGTLVAHDTTHLSARIDLKANTSALSSYVPTSRTVNGHALTSNVSVTTTDLSLQNVDNTSDANKPVSTATQVVLDSKPARDSVVMSKDSLTVYSSKHRTDVIEATMAGKVDLDTNNIGILEFFIIGDTTGTPYIPQIAYKTSDNHYYVCVALTGKKWKQIDN